MTNKRKPIRREVRCLYLALFKDKGNILSLSKMIGYYEEYNDLRARALASKETPMALKNNLPPLEMPKYLQWIKQYLI